MQTDCNMMGFYQHTKCSEIKKYLLKFILNASLDFKKEKLVVFKVHDK